MDTKTTTFQLNDWLVEPHLNQIRRGKKTKQIEPLTMNVLSHLLEHAGEVVTAGTLLDRYWPDRNAEPGMVSRCISQIRLALGDDARKPVYVETIRKRGYRTIADVRQVQDITRRSNDSVDVREYEATTASAPEIRNSIAVLPFENLSPDPSDAYLAAGIHEEVLNRLAKVGALSVIAQNSVVSYANGTHSISDITNDLGVSAVMTGSLQYAGGWVRFSAHLIEPTTGTLKWSETYTRELADIFSIQTDIAIQIAKAMEVQFAHDEHKHIDREPTKNVDAYTYYIRAVHLLGNWQFVDAIRQLEKAIALDPDFALALAHMAYLHSIAGTSGFGASDVMNASEAMHSMSIAASLVQRVFEIDPSQALAHTAQGKIEMYNRNWDAVTLHSASGYALNPDQIDVAFAHAWSLLDEGQHERGFRVHDQIMILDPLNSPVPLHASIRARMAGRQDVAIRLCKTYIHEKPADPRGYLFCALSAAIIDDTITAQAMIDRVGARLPLSKLAYTDLVLLLEVQQRLGNVSACADIEGVLSRIAQGQTFERDVPIFYKLASRNATDAFRALQHAAESQIPSDLVRDLHHYPLNPLFDPIRHHPEFQSLLAFIAQPARAQATPIPGIYPRR